MDPLLPHQKKIQFQIKPFSLGKKKIWLVMQSCQKMNYFRSEPTKLDYDVMLALGDCHINKATHPCLAHWLEIVRSYTEDEQKW